MTRNILVVSGPQGSGKSTQAELIAKRYGLPLFEAGVELRSYVGDKLPGYKEIEQYMEKGLLVPHHYLNELFFRFVDSHDCQQGLVSDGFPRSMEQWHVLESVQKKIQANIIGIYVSVTQEVALERIKKRVEVHDGKVAKREDDTPEALQQRFKIYHEDTMPVINHIREFHQLIEIEGDNSMEEVSEAVANRLNNFYGDASKH